MELRSFHRWMTEESYFSKMSANVRIGSIECLTTLAQAGWFKNLDGIVLGSFSEGDPGADGVSVEDVFRDHFGDFEIPVLHGLSAGHISENEPLTFGAEARIDGSSLYL